MKNSVQDGAFSWLVCAASFMNITIFGGFLNSGIFYIMFKNALDGTDSEVALITAINIAMMHVIAPFAGMLSQRYGIRGMAMTGAVLSTAGLVGAAFSTHIYHLYISFGFVTGSGLGMMYTLSISIINPYFNKYKRTACGLAITGNGVGAFIYPPILKSLEDQYGWRGALIILAGITAHMLVFSSIFRPPEGPTIPIEELTKNGTVEMGQPSNNGQLSKGDDIIDVVKSDTLLQKVMRVFSLFKILPYLCLCLHTLVRGFPYSIIITHFGSYVLTIGFSAEDVVRLYMAFGLTSTICRPLAGILAQVFNANACGLMMIAILLDGLLTMVVPFMNQLWMLYVYVIVFQIFMTPYVALGPVIVMEDVPALQVSTAMGLFQSTCVPGYLLGAPASVWLYQSTQVYAHSFILAGGLLVLAGLTMAPGAYHIYKKRRRH